MSKKFFFVKYFIFILVLGVLFFALNLRRGFAQNVTINLVVVNGSEEPKETPIKYFLPSELKPEDIIEKGSLDLDYDKDKARHFVFGSARLEPKESRTIKLTTKDVWRIDESEINIIKTQLEQNLTALEQTEFYSSATILRDGVMQKLNYIAERQQRFSDNIERRIEEYRANLEMFNEIKKNVFSSDYLKSNIAEPQTEGTIRFVIEAENASQDEVKTISQKYYLPREIRAHHIIDDQGFDIRYDEEREQAYLTKEEEFQPAEKKRYTIIMRDAWRVSDAVIFSLEERTKQARQAIISGEGSDFTIETGNFLAGKIFELLNVIRESQSQGGSVEQNIGLFRVNKRRLEEAERYLIQLERSLALISGEKLQEFEKISKSQVKNILQKIQALRGLSAISTALFGKRLSITMTWRIVWAILAFVAFFTSIHFFTWRSRSKFMGEENAKETGGQFKEVGAVDDKEGKSES